MWTLQLSSLACLLTAVLCQYGPYTPDPYTAPYSPPACTYDNEGETTPVAGVCFAYYLCYNGESLYQECYPGKRYDEYTGSCVDDASCTSACPPWVRPNPDDYTTFYLGEGNYAELVYCPYGTIFSARPCTCVPKPYYEK